MALGSSARLGWWRGVWAAVVIAGCVFLHEVAHAAVARWNGVSVSRIGIGFKGGFTVRKQSHRLRTELLITGAGPLMNLVILAVFEFFSTPFARWIALCNVVLVIANLFPFGRTDGARLRRTIMTMLRARRLAPVVDTAAKFDHVRVPAEGGQSRPSDRAA